MAYLIEGRFRMLVPGAVTKGIIVCSDKVQLNDRATEGQREAVERLSPFDIGEFKRLVASHIIEARGSGRLRADNSYVLNGVLLGGMLGLSLQPTEHRQIAAWLRILHKVQDNLQFTGKLTFQYAPPQDQPTGGIFTPTMGTIDRRSLSLEDSLNNLTKIMVPVLGASGVNFQFIRPAN